MSFQLGTSQTVGSIGYGLMSLTWRLVPVPDSQAFPAIKLAIDEGCTFLNSGEFYGTAPNITDNLKLLNRFFIAYPDYRSKVFISVKGGMTENLSSDSSLEYLRRSVENINSNLGFKMDLFEPARVDQTRSIEETMKNMQILIEEGHFKYIGLSEVSEKTIRAAAKIGKITAVEAEYSFFSLDIERNGVKSTCEELGIPIIAYSPLARGFLSGTIRSKSDIPEGDMRHRFDRFSVENFPKNLVLVDELQKLADKKSTTLVKLALAWLLTQGVLPIPGSTREAGVKEAADSREVDLSKDELKEIRELIDRAEVVGGRYNSHMEASLAV